MRYDKKHDIECQLDKLIDDLVSFKEGIDHFEGAINVINSDPIGDMPDYALTNARLNLVYCREGLEAAEIEYRAVKKELAWYEFVDAETTSKTFFDYRGVATNGIAFLSAAMFTAKLRQAHFTKTNCPYVAALHAQIAADFEWLLFQECN